MHILLIHQAFAAIDEPGGTRHHEIARYLAAQGHKVTIIASPVSYLTGAAESEKIPWQTEQQDGERITILRAYTYRALHKSFVHRVFSFISFMVSSFFIGLGIPKVDLVWGTTPPIFQGMTAWLLARLKGAPFVFEVRDLWPAFAIAVGVLKNKLIISMSEWLEKFLYNHADHLIVNSPGFITHLQHCCGITPRLVPNGADVTMFDPSADGASFRAANDIPADAFVVLYAGAHGLSNDLGVVLEAAQILKEEDEVLFVFVGDGKEKDHLLDQAAELDLTNVRFVPPVPKDGMSNALAAADACLAILKPLDMYKTVYPNKVFDYMAAGRPVILAIDGVIRDVVHEADAGIFSTPGNARELAEKVLQVYTNPETSRVMGQNGRNYVEKHFDRQKLAHKLEQIFEDVIARS